MVNKSTQSNEGLLRILEELENPEVQKTLSNLLQKLPEFEKGMDSVSSFVGFGKAVLDDQEALSKYDTLASTYSIHAETIHAMVALVEKLPKLVELMEKMESLMSFVTAVLDDKQSTQYVMNSAKEYAEPLLNKGKDGLALVERIQVRAETHNTEITLFSLVKWIKDPAVQKALNYAQATIDVLNEKQKK